MTLVFFREQELQNLLHHKKYLKALGLAISLDQPFRVLSVIKGMLTVVTGARRGYKYAPGHTHNLGLLTLNAP